MKKILNKPEDLVLDMCQGIVMAHPELNLNEKYRIVTRKNLNSNKVSLISGGGSGHEPAHAGLVGKGMLDAAVCGDVFASPSQIQVYQAIRETASDKGTLLIIKNYSGDIMNFKNAAYLAKEDGINVDFVKVEDDVAVEDSLYTVGRRGVAGTILVHKIAGAASEKGLDLENVKRIAQKAADNVRSIGFALTSCTVPAKGTPTFSLEDDEIEYGVGIHGEPGVRREKTKSSQELAETIINTLAEDLSISYNQAEKTEVVLLVNGFGATPLQELYVLNNDAMRLISDKKIKVHRCLVGNYMTSIDMAGASITILKLDDELKKYLNYECFTPSLKFDGSEAVPVINYAISKKHDTNAYSDVSSLMEEYSKINGDKLSLGNMIYIVGKMSESVISNEVPFCELDSHAGDGDFGMSIAKGFRKLQNEWGDILEKNSSDIGSFLDSCSLVIMEHCGGASGPIWGSAFRAAAKAIGNKTEIGITEFADMMQAAVKAIQKTGERSFGRGAVVGDKTLIDALVPCADSWTNSAERGLPFYEAFALGAKEAVQGAKSTEKFAAKMGRAGNVGERSIGYPDAGAHGLGVIFTDIVESLDRI